MKKIILTSLIFTGCIAQKKVVNPEAPNEPVIVKNQMTKRLSQINIPFTVTIADIESQINKAVPTLIYEDNSFTDQENDNFKCKVLKKDKIVFTAFNKDICEYTVPLKIWAEKGIGALGFVTYQSTEFEMKLKFKSKFQINPDWTFQTITDGNGYEWISKPVLKFGSIEVPLTPIIGKLISNNHAGFARKIDETVKQTITFKPYMQQAWVMAHQPLMVNEEYKTWVKLSPTDVSMSPLIAEGKNLKSQIGISTYTETFLGEKPNVAAISNAPNFKKIAVPKEDFEIVLLNEIPYAEATTIAKKMFNGQKYEFQNGKVKIEVVDMDIYGAGEKLIIKTDLKGDLKGSVYMKGTPVYSPEKQMVVFADLDYDFKSKNALLKAANWLLEGKLTKMFQENLGIPVQEIIDAAKAGVEESLAKPLAKGVKMNGTIEKVIPENVYLTPTGILAVVTTYGKLDLKVDGLN